MRLALNLRGQMDSTRHRSVNWPWWQHRGSGTRLGFVFLSTLHLRRADSTFKANSSTGVIMTSGHKTVNFPFTTFNFRTSEGFQMFPFRKSDFSSLDRYTPDQGCCRVIFLSALRVPRLTPMHGPSMFNTRCPSSHLRTLGYVWPWPLRMTFAPV